jgi:hypothetical protein
MAESPEHKFLSETFTSVLNELSASKLYLYSETQRRKFDFACVLAEDWTYLIDGQTLWKHTEGIDKDIRTLLAGSQAQIMAYVARDTVPNHNTLSEIVDDYRHSLLSTRVARLKVFWVPGDFDADIESHRESVRSNLSRNIIEDVLFNIILGHLSSRSIRRFLTDTRDRGLGLAILNEITRNGFVSLNRLQQTFGIGYSRLRDRIHNLQLSGLLFQVDESDLPYVTSPAGRTFLRIAKCIYDTLDNPNRLSDEMKTVLELLGLDWDIDDYTILHHREIFDTPKGRFQHLSVLILCAAKDWSVAWEELPMLAGGPPPSLSYL